MIDGPNPEMIDLFLQEASEHLQFLREYSGILQDPYPLHEDIERLYISAHGVAGTGGTYGYALFNEVASKLAQIFHYAMNATISQEIATPLVEFIYEAIAVLESDLIMISANSVEAVEEIESFKQRYPFAFQPAPAAVEQEASAETPEEKPAAPAEPASAAASPSVPAAAEPSAPEPSKPPAAAEPVAAPAETALEPVAPVAAHPEHTAPAEAGPPPEPEPEEPAAPAPAAPESVAQAAESAAPAEPEPVAAEPVAAEKPEEIEKPAPAPPLEAVPAVEAAAPAVSEILVAPVTPEPEARVEAESIPEHPEAEAPAAEVAHVAAPAEETVAAPEPEPTPAAPAEVQAPAVAAPAEPAAAASPEPEAAEREPQETEAASAESETELAESEAERAADLEALTHPDPPLPAVVLEFFIPEVEEHLQTITDCLLALEASPNPEEIHRVFRSMHTIKGSAAQVGARRISAVAHRSEDLLGRMRDGELQPTAAVIDLCLESVDVLKKMIYRQWESEAEFQSAAHSLIESMRRIGRHEAESKPEVVQPEAVQVQAVEVQAVQAQAVPSEAAEAKTAEAVVEPPAAPSPVEMPLAEVESAEEVPVAAEPFSIPEAPPESTPAEPMVTGKPAAAESLSPLEPLLPTIPRILEVESPRAAEKPAAAASKTSASKPADEEPKIESLDWLVAQRPPVGMAQSKSVRIALERLDRMMNAVGELVINRTRMLGRLEELEKLADVLNFSKGRMTDKVTEFQDKYEFSRIGVNPIVVPPPGWRGVSLSSGLDDFSNGYGHSPLGFGGIDAGQSEFSELEMYRYDDFGILSRSLTEISADITEVLNQLDSFVRRVDGDIDEFTKLAHRLQDEITQARMVPIGGLFTRITRTVRDAAKASNKKVELSLAGAETELDNNIVQQIADPLLHLVRNAVAHGIEGAEERYESGKPDEGHIAVRAYHKGNHIYVEVEDDGRGIDLERVRKTAVEGGFVPAKDAENLGRRELFDLLFRPGFSTAPSRTELAGRGVGLDVVRSNLNALNGEIEIETEKAIGSRFTLKVPLTLIISQALFVQCGEQTFAFPLSFVEEIRRISPAEIEEVSGKLITRVRDVLTEVVRLDDALQLSPLQPVNGYLRLVLVNVGGRQVGVVVEEVLRKDEIVIKSLGEYLHNVKLFPGATIAPDGSLILLVDLNRLIMGESIERRPLKAALQARRHSAAAHIPHGAIPAAAIDKVEREKVVVLADDSISVRRFVGRMLEKAGYRVKLASDGLEALEIATTSDCDLVITDLEMPRTNGYELILHLRQTPSTARVPVMVVTSRAGSKHRERALKEGAAAFMVKPVQEETFIAQVEELIGSSGQAVAPEVQ